MPETTIIKEALKAAMQQAMPTRVITRDLADFAMRSAQDLDDGVLTLIGLGERDFVQVLGRSAQLGTMPLLLVGQIRVEEDAPPSAIEGAEDALVDEVKAFCRSLPSEVGSLSLLSYRQSGQTEHPFGWVAIDLEYLT